MIFSGIGGYRHHISGIYLSCFICFDSIRYLKSSRVHDADPVVQYDTTIIISIIRRMTMCRLYLCRTCLLYVLLEPMIRNKSPVILGMKWYRAGGNMGIWEYGN